MIEPALEALARSWPTLLVAVVGWLGVLWAWRGRVVARSEREHEEQRLQGRATRYQLDALRQALHALVVLTGAEGKHSSEAFDLSQLVRHRELIGMVTDEFWVHDGHPSERARRRSDVEKWMTRTQAIKLKNERVDSDGLGGAPGT